MSAIEVYFRIVGILAVIGTAGFVVVTVGAILPKLFTTIPELFGKVEDKPCRVCDNEAEKTASKE